MLDAESGIAEPHRYEYLAKRRRGMGDTQEAGANWQSGENEVKTNCVAPAYGRPVAHRG
jgi:hypothetical protein